MCLKIASPHLCHVDEAERQRLVAQDGPVLVPLPPLQHDLQLVGVSFQEVWILQGHREVSKRRFEAIRT